MTVYTVYCKKCKMTETYAAMTVPYPGMCPKCGHKLSIFTNTDTVSTNTKTFKTFVIEETIK